MRNEVTNDSAIARSTQLNHRLSDIGWGLLLIITGVIWLVPVGRVPEGAWLFGVAAILVGINVVRYFKHVRVSGFSLALGLAALVAALTAIWDGNLPLVAIGFIIVGASLIVKPLLTRTT